MTTFGQPIYRFKRLPFLVLKNIFAPSAKSPYVICKSISKMIADTGATKKIRANRLCAGEQSIGSDDWRNTEFASEGILRSNLDLYVSPDATANLNATVGSMLFQ
jgi:hypothetical protein